MKHGASAFCLGWRSEVALPQFDLLDTAPADIAVRVTEAVPERSVIARHGNVCIFTDGAQYRIDDGTLIDIRGTDRVDICPAKDWSGEVHIQFYGTAAAMVLASRGLVPIHGTALEVEGRAILLCGRSGAGKSSLGAHLLARGARLISDDLSVVRVETGSPPRVLAGRPGMRLHPQTATWLAGQCAVEAIVPSHDGKMTVRPPRVTPFSEYALQSIILLDRQDTVLPDALQVAALRAQVYRPRLMRKFPGHATRMAALAVALRKVGLTRIADLSRYDQEVAVRRAELIWNLSPVIAA